MTAKSKMRIHTVKRTTINSYDIKHDEKTAGHVQQIVKILNDGGELYPVVVDIEACIIAGIHTYHAFRQAQVEYIPICIASHLTPYQVSAYRTADKNSQSVWDDNQIFHAIEDECTAPAEQSALGVKEMDFLRKVIHAQDKNNKKWRDAR